MKKENEKLIQIAYAIKNEVKRKPSKNKGRYFNFIFLCGGAQYEGDNRALLKKLLSKREDIRCLYSENLFQLLDTNLLTFEELLFETSTNVIIIVESFGSACELGAFSYIDDSINKLIVINDADYKNEASFINDGPIKKIYDVNNNNVFFETFVYDTANHKRLILSSNLVNRLLDGIPINKSFLEKDILVENDVLKISDLSYFQIVIFEIIKFFTAVSFDELIKLIKILYDVKEVLFHFSSGNTIDSSSSLKSDDVIHFLVSLLLEFELIYEKAGIYYINYSSVFNDNFDFSKQNSLLFKSDYLRSKKYFHDKASVIRIIKQRGYNIWEK